MNVKIVTAFKKLGFSRIQAQALDYLITETKWPIRTRDVELKADLRQNEANAVIRDFVQRGWLEEYKAAVQSGKKGKPANEYRFKLDKAALYHTIEAAIKGRVNELNSLVSKDLKEALQVT